MSLDTLDKASPQKEEQKKYQKRTAARLACVQGAFQILEMGMPFQEVLEETLLKGARLEEEVFLPLEASFFETLLRGTLEQKASLDEIIRQNLKEGWSFEKIDKMLLSILRVSIHELLKDSKTDISVLIKEYTLITDSFFDDKKVSFVHRTLDHLGKVVRPFA